MSELPSPYHRLRAGSTDADGGAAGDSEAASASPQPPLSATARQRNPAATAAASSSAAATAAASPSSSSASAASPSSRPSWGRVASEQHRSPIVMKPPSRHTRTTSVGINVSPAAAPGGKHHAATLRLPPGHSLTSPVPGASTPQSQRSATRGPAFMGSPRQASMRALRLLAQPNNDDVPSSSSSSSSSDDEDSEAALRRKLRAGSGAGGGSGSGGNSGSNSRPLSRQGSQHSLFISGSGAGPVGEHSIVLEGDEAAAMAADAASFEREDEESESSAEEEEAIIQRWNQQVLGGVAISAAQPPATATAPSVIRNLDGSAHVGSMPVQITSALNGRTGPIEPSPAGSPACYGSVSRRSVGGTEPVDIAKQQGDGDDDRRDSGPNSGSNSAAVSAAGSLVGSGSMVDAGYMAASSPGVERRRKLRDKKSVRYGTMPAASPSSSATSSALSSRRKHSLAAGGHHRFDSVAGLQAAAAAAALDPTQSPIFESEQADNPDQQRSSGRGRSGSGKKLRWKTVLRRIPYYIPCLQWMPAYSWREDLLGDFLAGLSVAVMLVPQGLTYATLANLPPLFGLYTAFFPLMIYVLMGSSKHLSLGPEVTSSILIGKAIAQFPSIPDGDLADPDVVSALISAALAMSLAIGIASLALGVLRLGFLDSILSKPMVAGFVLAVAVTLVCEQLPVLLGMATQCGDTCKPGALPGNILIYTLGHLSSTNWRTALISLGCCSLMFAVAQCKRRWPENRILSVSPDVLLVVVIATFFSWWFELESHGVHVLGDVGSGLSVPAIPNLNQGNPAGMISAAFTITILGFVETQLTNKRYASKHQYIISPNRELVALGAASIIGSVFGAYSAFGSSTRTKVAESAGVRSQMANGIAGLLVLFVIMFFVHNFSFMPKCVSASIVLVVAMGLMEFKDIRFIIRVRNYVDFALLVSMFVLTIVLGVGVGIFFAFATCLLMAVKQTTLPGVTMLGRGFANDDFHDLSDVDEQSENVEGILIYKLDGPLYFANAEKLKDSTKRAETQGGFHIHPSEEPHPMAITSVVFDLSALTSVDSSALLIFLDIVTAYRARNARVCLVKLRKSLRESFSRAGILDVVGRDSCFRKLEKAVEDIQRQNLSNLTTAVDVDVEEREEEAGGSQSVAGEGGVMVDLVKLGSPSSASNESSRSNSVAAASSVSSLDVSGAIVLGAASPGGVEMSGAMVPPQPPPQPLYSSTARRKKSSFFGPPIVGSPLLRGITKMKM